MEVPNLEQLLGKYRDFCILKGHKRLTIELRIKVLRRVLKAVSCRASEQVFTEYVLGLYKSGKKNSYISHTIGDLRSLCEYLQSIGINIKLDLKKPRPNPSNKAVFSDEEIAAFFPLSRREK